jgi:TonB family protein
MTGTKELQACACHFFGATRRPPEPIYLRRNSSHYIDANCHILNGDRRRARAFEDKTPTPTIVALNSHCHNGLRSNTLRATARRQPANHSRLALAVLLSSLGYQSTGPSREQGMKLRAGFSLFALIMLLAGGSIASAQNSSPDESAKRQIKSRTDPAYPALAREMHVNGKVKIEVTVAADGVVRTTKVLGGSPLLVKASVDAVKNWKYESAPRETTETVEFVFNNF